MCTVVPTVQTGTWKPTDLARLTQLVCGKILWLLISEFLTTQKK